MPILVEPDSTIAGVLSAALPGGAQVVSLPDEVDAWLNGRREYVLVIGPTLDIAAASTLADRVRAGHPAITVVLTRLDLEPQVYAQAMQAGIGAVVAADDHAALAGAVSRAKSNWEAIHGPSATPEGERDGKVFMIFSPKGGVGKTTMAVNLSVALAKSGAEVCVVDLDLAFGDVAITMQLIPEHTITEAAASEDDLDFALLQKLLTRHVCGLTILAAPTHPEGRDLVTASLARRVIQTLRRHFDFVVIDTPPGFDDQVLGAFDETDECIIVTTLDVPTIKNTKVAMETLDLLNLVPGNRHLVLNRADEEVGLNQGNVEDILGKKVSIALASSPAVAMATNHGKPIVLSKPDHPVSKTITGFAAQLAGGTVGAKSKEPARRGLFGRKK